MTYRYTGPNMANTTANTPPIFRLPDELLEAIVTYIPPAATLAFGSTCRRNNKITFEPLVWRRHCVEKWRYWEARHELQEKLLAPPAQTKWQLLYNERTRIDREALDLFDQMLLSQQLRWDRMERIAAHGYDVKDLMLKLKNETPETVEDVLARRYHANAILGQIHRATALEKWSRLASMQMVRLEEVLGAFDLFVLSGQKGDLNDMDRKFNEIANAIRDRDPEWEELSIRTKAIRVARYLRSEGLVGNPHLEDYHALKNNFITLALESHTSLPLQSVAIYCAVARRLGIDAKPANYPQHVHAVIKGPRDQTLDGRPMSTVATEPETMHMDPWRNAEEMPIDQLQLRLVQMGAPPAQHYHHLGPASTLAITIRAGRNIMHSVQEARERQRGVIRTPDSEPDIEAAWYSMLWAMVTLGDPNNAHTLHRRRQCLPYLIEHFQLHFPEDLGLIEKYIPPMFSQEREHEILGHLVETTRASDRNKKAPSPRDTPAAKSVRYKIGHHFTHRRYGYEGIIVGWDTKCGAAPRWIEQMHVDDLPRGREQPFYNVVYDPLNLRVFYKVLCMGADNERRSDDKTVRYVAEENIAIRNSRPGEALMKLAGRYFNRWDEGLGRFVSNLREEYPDD